MGLLSSEGIARENSQLFFFNVCMVIEHVMPVYAASGEIKKISIFPKE